MYGVLGCMEVWCMRLYGCMGAYQTDGTMRVRCMAVYGALWLYAPLYKFRCMRRYSAGDIHHGAPAALPPAGLFLAMSCRTTSVLWKSRL